LDWLPGWGGRKYGGEKMLSRLIQYGLVGVFALAIAGYGNNAFAQDDPCDDDPCADPCSDGDPCAGDDDDDDDDDGGDPCGGDPCGDGGGDTGGGDMAMEGAAPPATGVAKGKIAIWVDVGLNLSADAVAKPFAIAPDVWYGVSDKLAVGLAHSGYAANGFLGAPNAGLCLAGEDNGCISVYNNLAGLAKFAVMAEAGKPLSVVVNGGVVIPNIKDTLLAGLKVGADVGYMTGKIHIGVSPNIYIGVTERDFNKEALNIPVMVGYGVNEKLKAGVQTGIAGPLDGFGDAFRVPLSLAAMYNVGPKINAGGAFTLFNIAGKNSSADFRSLNIFVNYNL
jgi:hypothetical protein